MANIETRDQATILSNQVVAMQAEAEQNSPGTKLDFSAGSVLLAIAQAVTGVVLWLQGMILQLLTLVRAATSSGADLDSWMADFSFTRLPGISATGTVTFSRFTATTQVSITSGTLVQTADGQEVFAVTTDTTNVNWNAAQGAYVMGIGTSSIDVPVQAQTSGTGGNVLAHTITTIAQSLPGVDTVDNAAAFTNGIDQESDTAFRARFVLYINSLSKGTKPAVEAAIDDVQQGLTDTITENAQYNGTLDNGYFYAVVDDGSGAPSDQLIAQANAAIDGVRALGIRYGVFKPVVTTVAITMNINVDSNYNPATVTGAVGTALTNFLNSMVLDQDLPYTSIPGIAYGIAGVTNVVSYTVNGGTSDITVDSQHVIKAGTITVNKV